MILDQANEDNLLDFEHSDAEDDVEERLHQQAESVPLRSSDYVDPVEAVAAHWLVTATEKALETQHAVVNIRPRKGPLKLSTYDKEDPQDLAPSAAPTSVSQLASADLPAPLPVPPTPVPPSDGLPATHPVPPSSSAPTSVSQPTPAPPSADLSAAHPVPPPADLATSSASPSVPQVVVDFLVNSLTQGTPPTIPDSSTREAQAWNILNDYLNGTLEGDGVKTSLDELQLGDEWDKMRIRIMQMEPGKEDEAAELQHLLNEMKPAQNSAVADDPSM